MTFDGNGRIVFCQVFWKYSTQTSQMKWVGLVHFRPFVIVAGGEDVSSAKEPQDDSNQCGVCVVTCHDRRRRILVDCGPKKADCPADLFGARTLEYAKIQAGFS